MKDFLAFTESGANYTLVQGGLTIRPARGGEPQHLRPSILVNVSPEVLDLNETITLTELMGLPRTDEPELGSRLFAMALSGEWRLSTPVVAFRLFTPKDTHPDDY